MAFFLGLVRRRPAMPFKASNGRAAGMAEGKAEKNSGEAVAAALSGGHLLVVERRQLRAQYGAAKRRRWNAVSDSTYSGYNLARMRFEILLAPEAVEDLRKLKASERTAVKEALETHLRHEPTKASRSRIKRLRGMAKPQFRLRVEEVRVFYDVSGSTVEVLAIVPKPEAESWLTRYGNPK